MRLRVVRTPFILAIVTRGTSFLGHNEPFGPLSGPGRAVGLAAETLSTFFRTISTLGLWIVCTAPSSKRGSPRKHVFVLGNTLLYSPHSVLSKHIGATGHFLNKHVACKTARIDLSGSTVNIEQVSDGEHHLVGLLISWRPIDFSCGG